MNNQPSTPWYREPWAWYMLTIILVTFIWGGIQLYTAFAYQDSVVIDDYYKYGRTINQDMTRSDNARAMAIVATIAVDDLTGEVRVTLQGQTSQWPPQLKLNFLSPVFQDQDHTIDLNRTPGPQTGSAYIGQLSKAIAGRYYLQLETPDMSIPEAGYSSGWKITQQVNIVPGATLTLASGDQ